MIKELRKLRAKGGTSRSKANYISSLQSRGRIKVYINAKGYICYDTEELAKYKKTAHRGRPCKVVKEKQDD